MAHVSHLVLLRLREDADASTLFAELAALRHLIPGLRTFSGGPNTSPEGIARGYTHSFAMTFESAAARDAYLPHPEHVRVKALVLAALADAAPHAVVAIDHDIGPQQ